MSLAACCQDRRNWVPVEITTHPWGEEVIYRCRCCNRRHIECSVEPVRVTLRRGA